MGSDVTATKQNGVYYTPSELAAFLVKRILKPGMERALDPSYGDGALLLAAEKFSKESTSTGVLSLHGCDVKPVNGLLSHLPEANLKKIDFFEFPTENKYDAILMNPPFVRHHIQDREVVSQYRKNIELLQRLHSKSDLWAYFLTKSVCHLADGGSIGAILPWSFIQADYAVSVREWLTKQFRSIRVLGLTGKYFEGIEERVVLLWLENYGQSAEIIEFGVSKTIEDDAVYSPLTANGWTSPKLERITSQTTNSIFTTLQNQFGFKKFNQVADIKIGIVTGANQFFITSLEDARKNGFSDEHLKPIVTSSKQLIHVVKNELDQLPRMIVVEDSDASRYTSWIKRGELQKIHLRAHPSSRTPWYLPRIGAIPDAFFPYRSSKMPFLVLNEGELQSLNSVHRVYFKNQSGYAQKWIHLSMLSAFGQLGLETNSKTYGKDFLKMEPTSLGETLVFAGIDSSVSNCYAHVVQKLSFDKREEASSIATDFLCSALNIPRKLRNSATALLVQLREQRGH